MKLIQPNTIGAEIGVWEGTTSQRFLNRNVSKLYLVDPWAVEGYKPALDAADETFNYEKYINRYKGMVGSANPNDFQKYYDEVYKRVSRKFKNDKRVEICRMLSTNWFETYSGEKLDWIYIDGDHSYTGVINDLRNAIKVVKKGGLIIGDDYKWHSEEDKGGVKKAVKEFIAEQNLKVNQYGKVQFVIQL
jgi:hypothetical protein